MTQVTLIETIRSAAAHGITTAALATCVALGGVMGCASRRTVHVVERSDPASDVAFYERVVQSDPENAYAHDRLTEARGRLAYDLAIDAQVALRQRRFIEAHRLASRAAEYDERYIDLRLEAGRRLAHVYLGEAESALAVGDFARARSRVEGADRALPQYGPTTRLRERIDQREAAYFAELAEAYLADGDIEGATHAVERAVRTDPNNVAIVRLRTRINDAGRRQWADAKSDDVLRLITRGRLNDAESALERLRAANPRSEEVASLSERLSTQRREAAEALAAAEQLMADGRFEEAAPLILMARDLDADLDVDAPLAQALGGAAHQHMVRSMEAGDARSALLAARRTLEHVRDPQTEQLLPQLELAFIQSTLREAANLQRERRIDEARSLIDSALQLVEDNSLREFRARLDG